MLFSYLFFISSLSICSLFAYLADKYNSKLVRNLLICFLVLITGFRSVEVGIDSANYAEIWDAVLVGIPVFLEVGFQMLIQFLQRISTNPTILFVTCSIITFDLLIIRLWDFRNVASFTVMILVLFMLVVMPSMNTMRQYCAVSIVFYGTKFLFQKKYLKFILSVLIATSLHTSSLLGIVFIGFELLDWKQFSFLRKTCFVLLIIIGLSLAGLAYNYIISEYGHYFEDAEAHLGLLTIGSLLFIILAFGASKLNRKKIGFNSIEISKSHFLILVSFVAYIFGMFLQSLGYFFQYMGRVGLLFSIWGIVFWGVLFKLTKHKLLIIVYFLALLLFVAWPFISSMLGNSLGVMPYSFCW